MEVDIPLNKEAKPWSFQISLRIQNTVGTNGMSLHGIVASVLSSDIAVSEFEFRLCFYIPFVLLHLLLHSVCAFTFAFTLDKVMKRLIIK